MNATLAALFFIGVMPAVAQDAPRAPAAAARAASGWAARPSSLVLYDSSGSVVTEIGLGPWQEDIDGDEVRLHNLRGGSSADGHFAWAWEKIVVFPKGRPEEAKEESRLMRYMGTDGTELWRDDLADAPSGIDPVAISSGGETVLVAEQASSDWVAAAFSYTGNRIMEVHGKGPLESVLASPDGRFALAYFHPIDEPPSCILLSLRDHGQRKVPLDGIVPAPLTLRNGGLVYAGSKLLFDPDAQETKASSRN